MPGTNGHVRYAEFVPEGHWVAEVQTSAFGGAGTSATVFMVLHGERGSTGKIPLEGHHVMQRGALDVFTLPSGIEQLGHLVKLTLGHDNKVRQPHAHTHMQSHTYTQTHSTRSNAQQA